MRNRKGDGTLELVIALALAAALLYFGYVYLLKSNTAAQPIANLADLAKMGACKAEGDINTLRQITFDDKDADSYPDTCDNCVCTGKPCTTNKNILTCDNACDQGSLGIPEGCRDPNAPIEKKWGPMCMPQIIELRKLHQTERCVLQ
jgi:hypothetical protein